MLNSQQPFIHPQVPSHSELEIATITHDFKNLLTIALGNLSLAQAELDASCKTRQKIIAAEKATQQALEMAQHLIAYAKTGIQPTAGTTHEVATILKDVIEWIRPTTATIIDADCPDHLGAVAMSALQLTRIFQNFIINALQATDHKGVLKIKGFVDHPHDQIDIEFQDNGCGMDYQTLQSIFKAGFTTKQEGQGLGLFQCKRLIEAINGQLEVESQVGEGTVFRVILPRLKQPIQDPSDVQPASIRAETTDKINNQRILVLEDDAHISQLAGHMLEHLGYQAELVHQPEEAVRLYRQARETGSPFQSVILDLSLKDQLDGQAVFERLKAYDPGLKAIISTGHTQHPIAENYRGYGFSARVLKPYNLNELKKALHESHANEVQ